MHQLQRSWVWSQHPSAQLNLRGGRWSSVEYSTNKSSPPPPYGAKRKNIRCWLLFQRRAIHWLPSMMIEKQLYLGRADQASDPLVIQTLGEYRNIGIYRDVTHTEVWPINVDAQQGENNSWICRWERSAVPTLYKQVFYMLRIIEYIYLTHDVYCRVAWPGWSADSLGVWSLWYRVQSVSPSCTVPINCKTDSQLWSISYLRTYDLYSPVLNVLDACITDTAYPSGGQVGGGGGGWKSRVFSALWNGIEPIDECHLGPIWGRLCVFLSWLRVNFSRIYPPTTILPPNSISWYLFLWVHRYRVLAMGAGAPSSGAINCLGRFTRLCIVDWRSLSSGHDEKRSSECGMGGGGGGSAAPRFASRKWRARARVAKTLQYD